MSTLFAPYVRHVLHGSSQAYGLVAAVQAIGGLAGGVIAASVGRRISASQLPGWGAVAFGAVDLGIFLYPLGYVAVWPAAVGMVIVGVPGALTIAGAMTLFQRSTDDGLRGRVFGALGAVEGIAILAGYRDETKIAHRGAARTRAALDDEHLHTAFCSRQRAGQSDDASAHDREVESSGGGAHAISGRAGVWHAAAAPGLREASYELA